MSKIGKKGTSFIAQFANEWKAQTQSQKFLYFLYAFLLCFDLRALFYAIETRIGLSSYTQYSDGIIITIIIVGCVRIFLKNIRLMDIFLLLFLVFFHQISAVWYPETARYSAENASHFIWGCLPMYLVGLTVNKNSSPLIFVGISYIALFLLILFIGVLGVGTGDSNNSSFDEMGRAYSLLPFSLFLLWYAFDKGGLNNYIIAIIAVFLLLAMGTRGPVMCLVTFIAVYLFVKKTFKYNTLVKILIGLILFAFYLFSFEISLALAFLSSNLGLSTRVFDQAMMGQLMKFQESSGRDDLYTTTFNYLTKNSVSWGEGLYSDRYISGIEYYVHNLELEMWCAFGLIGGSILLLLLIVYIFRGFYKNRKSQVSVILLVFFCSSVIQLQFSGSFLTTPLFWFFMGICMSMQRNNALKTQ